MDVSLVDRGEIEGKPSLSPASSTMQTLRPTSPDLRTLPGTHGDYYTSNGIGECSEDFLVYVVTPLPEHVDKTFFNRLLRGSTILLVN